MAETTSTDAVPAEGSIPGLPADWPQQATTKVVGVVDNIRVKTSGPAIRVSRAIVYGLVAGILALIALPILLVAITRGLIYAIESLGNTTHGNAVWIAYTGVGTVLCAVGFFLWSRRPRGAARP